MSCFSHSIYRSHANVDIRHRFQWVKLQLDLFVGPHARLWHERDVTMKLDLLGKKIVSLKSNMLDQAYEDVYNNNTEEDSWSRVVATRALKWMICAQRSLFIKELAEVASINDDGTRDELTEDTLLKICSNFIIANEKDIAQFFFLIYQ